MNRMQIVFSQITRNRFNHSALKDFSSLTSKFKHYLPISQKLGSYCAVVSLIKIHHAKEDSNKKRFYGTRSNKPLSSKHTANQFVRWLLPEERSTLFAALQDFQAEEGTIDLLDGTDPEPTLQQLKLVMGCNAIPFVGFGMLDNGIMILAGEYIDHTVGVTLGISTMAAAAVGNLISDLMGLGLAGYVEAVAVKLGFDVPPMSTRQANMWKTKYAAYFGRSIGIAVGCIIGMFPLFFISEVDDEAKEHHHETRNSNS
ncbi:transmembrane protein 65-like isoform X2 [Rhopilema esculentum]|uniref:transmembrane protein 65-like isoform X2 n=1 Tax=Rhopilema esculentum TaxID=499914 RepID=UPI0031D0C501